MLKAGGSALLVGRGGRILVLEAVSPAQLKVMGGSAHLVVSGGPILMLEAKFRHI